MAFRLQLTILLLALLQGLTAEASATQTTLESSELVAHTSTLRPAVERVFSRKRRFLFLPPGASVKFTAQLSKNLIAKFPRGFNFVIEMATYYPVPKSREDLLPKRLRPSTPAPPPKPAGPTAPLLVYIPGTDLRFKARPVQKPKPVKQNRIDGAGTAGQLQWIDKLQQYKTSSNKWAEKDWNAQKWAKYEHPSYGAQYAWPPEKQAQYQWSATPPQRRKWTKWMTSRRPETYYRPRGNRWWNASSSSGDEWPRRERWGRETHRPWASIEEATGIPHPDQIDCEPMHFADLEPYENWSHYHSHRDRRQLFHQFEGLSKLLGIDMKTCTMRAICDAKRFLLPPGYSMIQDILRVVFHFPTIRGLSDDYSRIMAGDFEECDRRLRQSTPPCPLSILDWLSGGENTL